jgi:hypothetical protein
LSLSSQKYGFGIRDPRSGKNQFRIPDPGVKKAPDPGSGSATLTRNVSKYCSNLLGKEGLFFGRQTELLLVVNLK